MRSDSSRPRPVFTLDRRAFLAASAATCAMVGLRPTPALAATHTRKSLEGPNVGADLEGYKNAVRAMLALPPEDPRNWYRNAMTHLLDCPHGNWWFLVWHRGYLGWFERICREVTDNPAFALPYWDWTEEPKVPASFWG
ncbi:MAG: twin-arginine translocation signal domain-containing protein, partial [Deinococcus-Thermus bacterium]|nr:twin-arginine translocation signal domain-containing protein [Deinococcota bacterium]